MFENQGFWIVFNYNLIMNNRKDCKNLSNFKENLVELLKIKEIDSKDLLEKLHLNKNYLYDTADHSTLLESAISIANYLNLSMDFLCDRKSQSDNQFHPRNSEKFLSNLLCMLKQSKISQRTFCRDMALSSSCFTRWKSGSPYLSTVVDIADYLDCSIDDLLM